MKAADSQAHLDGFLAEQSSAMELEKHCIRFNSLGVLGPGLPST
jgi:hypothetical protein